MVVIQQIANAFVDVFRNFNTLWERNWGGGGKENTWVLDNQTEICLRKIISDII